ncbi:glucokinase [Desulfovibrio litoralis]|uniref:Glucokinase n=1 Tax=Desulfovibrio litoralis DSM 11393 TaxID=1121455 RepID=A0A1M7STC6_9BACT|nr:glucokinase [Desulfovibrio litoralis]SHN61732.1 glucokinase [Desulfovibrio litoralis DSM 11393]
MKILVADLGGTNCRFATVDFDKNIINCDYKNLNINFNKKLYLQTKDYKDCYALLSSLAKQKTEDGEFFLSQNKNDKPIDLAVFAIAGLVHNEKVFAPNMANNGWNIDTTECINSSGIKNLILINDFVAQAFACLTPKISKPKLIWGEEKNQQSKDPIAVIGAGTGLGMCLLVPNKNTFNYLPSEGGHASFSFENEEEIRFAEFMKKETQKRILIGDDIVSGLGLSLLHQYFYNEKLSASEVVKSFDKDNKVLETFARFYGRACRNYVLSTNAWSALYLTGGVGVKNPCIITQQAFIDSFYDCKAHAKMLKQTPVYLCTEYDTGLLGAAVYALSSL